MYAAVLYLVALSTLPAIGQSAHQCLINDNHLQAKIIQHRITKEVYGFKLDFRIQITNISNEDIFLFGDATKYELEDKPDAGFLYFASSQEAVDGCNYFNASGVLRSVYISSATERLKQELKKSGPEHRSIIRLHPNESLQIDETYHAQFPDIKFTDDQESMKAMLRKYPIIYLQAELIPWPSTSLERGNFKFAKALHKKWAKQGYLIYENFFTAPIQIELPN